MSYFIIIRGPLGSGKSTIAKKLAAKLDAEYISMDEVLAQNGLDQKPPSAPCIPVENFLKANELVISIAKDNLTAGKIVIFDACFYHKEAIEDLIDHLPFDHYAFTLKVPVELCIERDSKREKSYGEGAALAVHSLVSRFDYGINIDATESEEETINIILSHLPINKYESRKK